MTKSAQKEWCVYTGGWYCPTERTVDHVIPLAIGGHDAFVIRASEQGNEYVNRRLDEKFAKHPFVANLRRLRGLRGRRGEIPKVSWPSKICEVPAEVGWSSRNVKLRTYRSKGLHSINLR